MPPKICPPYLAARLEKHNMMEVQGKRWREHYFAEGKAEGLAEARAEGKAQARAEGKAEAKAESLECILVHKFGALPPSILTQIRTAQLAELETWFKRALNAAQDLPSVFAQPPKPLDP